MSRFTKGYNYFFDPNLQAFIASNCFSPRLGREHKSGFI